MLRVARQTGVEHPRNARLDHPPNLQRILALPTNAQIERLQPLQHDPGVERAQRRPGVARKGQQRVVDELLRPAHRTREHAPLPVHHLGRAIGGHVGAELHRPLQRGRGKGVIDDADDPPRPCDVANRFQINHIHRRIGRRFEEEQLGIGLARILELLRIARIDDAHLDPELGQQRIGQPAARSERRAPRDDMVAGLKLTQQHRGHRRHARRHRTARLSAFEQSDAVFEHLDRRILQPRIGHADLFAGEARGGIGGAIVRIARCQEQSLGGFAPFAARSAAAHGLRCGAPLARDALVLSGAAFHVARFAGSARFPSMAIAGGRLKGMDGAGIETL